MVDVERERFEGMVGEALDGPPRISARWAQRRRHLEHDDGRQGLLGRPCVVLVKCGRCRRVRPQTSKLVTAFEET